MQLQIRRQCPPDERAAKPHPALHCRPLGYRERSRPRPRSTSTTTKRPRWCHPLPARHPHLGGAGAAVAKGQPLALVASADFATAIGAYRKAAVAAVNARRVATADKDLAAHNGISEREAAQAQTDAASADADRDAALQALVSMGVDRGTISRAMSGSSSAGLAGVIRAPISGIVVDKQITPGQLLQAGSSTAFTVANLSQVWVLAQISPNDLSSVGVHDAVRSIPATALGLSTEPSTTFRHPSIPTRARSWPASSLPIPATSSRSRCSFTSRSKRDVSAPAYWCRSRGCSATTKICHLSISRFPTAASSGGMSRSAIATVELRHNQRPRDRRQDRHERRNLPAIHAGTMTEGPIKPVEPPRTGSSFINRIVAIGLEQRILVALLTMLLIGAGIRRMESVAGRCLSRPVAANGVDQRAMARPFGRRSGTADHRSNRARDERHSKGE